MLPPRWSVSAPSLPSPPSADAPPTRRRAVPRAARRMVPGAWRGTRLAPAAGRARAGLTMVELLLAVALLSLLMLAVFQLLDRSLSLWRKAETRRALLEEAATLSDLVARDLSGLEGGERGDLLAEWVMFDTDGDGVAETKWPRVRLVREAAPAEVERLPRDEADRVSARRAGARAAGAGRGRSGEADGGAGEATGGAPASAALERQGPALVEVVWMIAPASLIDKDARAEGILWRGERLCSDPSSKSFFAADFFGTSNRPPAGATEEVSDGVLWMGLLFASQTSIVHDGWRIGPDLDCAATSWDAWTRGRPDADLHPWNEKAAGMPAPRGRPLLPRRVRLELEIERPVDRQRRTVLDQTVDLTDAAIAVDDAERIPREEGAFVLVDAEWMRVTSVEGRRVSVDRAQRGSRPALHARGAMVHYGLSLVREVAVSTYREDWNL